LLWYRALNTSKPATVKGVQRKEDYQKLLYGSTSDLREHGEDGHANAW
jgi:hypothetical protein